MERNHKIIIGAIAGVVVVLIGLFIYGYQRQNSRTEVTLEFWGVFDDASAVQPLLAGFHSSQAVVNIHYTPFTDPLLYEQQLVNALAAGNGPDIFMIHNSWLPKHYAKFSPFTEAELPIIRFRELFPQVVEQDFAPDGVIYALPLSVDTLALIYNRDDFDNAGIPIAPKTWDEFENDVVKLRKVNPGTNEILHSAATIGGSAQSINRATDLLSLLMLQLGTQMTDDHFTQATFASGFSQSGGGSPGLQALNFYTQFANPRSPYYTWNEDLHYSIDNFQEGGVSMIFNYAYQAAQLKERNPFLKYVVAPMPQPNTTDNAVNFANYWGLAVSSQSKNPAVAHEFVLSVTTDEAIAKAYSETNQKPPALLSLIRENLNHPNLGVFVRQALTARTWPQIDNTEVEKIFSQMIGAVTSGRLDAESALREAENSVNLLMSQRRRP